MSSSTRPGGASAPTVTRNSRPSKRTRSTARSAALDPAALDRQPVFAPQVEVHLAVDVAARRRAHAPARRRRAACGGSTPRGRPPTSRRPPRGRGAARGRRRCRRGRPSGPASCGRTSRARTRWCARRGGTSGSPASRARRGAQRASSLAPLHVAWPAVDRGVTRAIPSACALEPLGDPDLDDRLPGHSQAARLAVERPHHPDGEVDVDALLLLVGSADASTGRGRR